MCGIAGFVGGFEPRLLERMNAVQAHRGPDGSGVFEEPREQVALGHVRLAILDLSDSAAQPMHSRNGRFVLTYNGEIYNFPELRELLEDGEPFRSSGDTEVLLRGLQRYGAAFVSRLNGMFAFALWDRWKRELLLARDPLGIKPVYYAEPRPGELLFASEMKAICAHPAIRREPDFAVIQQHLAFCHATSERTALKGVRRLPPGCTLTWKSGHVAPAVQRYWRPKMPGDAATSRSQGVEELRHALAGAVKRQLVSDVRVGAFLSGGLDSSLITALAARESQGFSGYTISFSAEENRLDQTDRDAPYARRLAASLGVPLQEIEISAGVASLLPMLVRQLDEPIADPAAISCFLVSRLAREHGVPVLLSGQGADELFGGYPRYRAMRLGRVFDRFPSRMRRAIAEGAAFLPGAWSGKLGAHARRARRLLAELTLCGDERFLAYCAATPQVEVHRILNRETYAGAGVFSDCLKSMEASGLEGVDRYLCRDLSTYLPNHNLLYTDKMGMAVGLEARVPLLDLELVDLVSQFPAEWKLETRRLKAILRDAAHGVLPDYVINRPKAGFGAPYRKWLRHDLRDMWNDLTHPSEVNRRGWFCPQALSEVRSRSQAGRSDLYMLQWAVLTMELWARQFIDANPAEGAANRAAA